MNLKKIGGKKFLVNLLSDFIVGKIPSEENSIIKIVDCGNFYVIKGKTTSKEVLFIPNIISEFNEKYKEYIDDRKLTHTIDLIEYDTDLKEVRDLSHTFHNNTSNCSYHYKDVENYENLTEKDDLVFISEFPYGHSLTQGRDLYYYGKHIFYSIPSNYPHTTLTLTLSKEKNEEGEQKLIVFDEFFKSEDDTLHSAILDVFDFDYKRLSEKMKKVDWSVELTNPLEEYSFLKERDKDFIIF
jgi:hypothetical protein